MAVLPVLPGLNISVLVDGELATEHIPQPSYFPPLIDATGHQRIEHNQCYIESRADSHFAIRFRISSDFKFPWGKTILIISIYVDGKPFDARLFQKRFIVSATRGGKECADYITYCHREYSAGSCETYNPIFQDIRHPAFQTDDGSGISDPDSIKALGSIQVAITVARDRGPGEVASDEFNDDKREPLSIDSDALHRYGSGQIHGTIYARAAENPEMEYVAVDREVHIGNFFFYYQSPAAEGARFSLQPRFIDCDANNMVHTRKP
ncbi:hypothetical protein J7337_011195 [Fusarium musae]|uniref:DUF7918 domain-containing protein n=1 Tax=Fusarium musae TaxID=1042133 RepID=A0A9P8DAH0_9HYPO|nr:hypothetical protein J7337_011195 [Fusarium musae]KAG9498298.1 hypothetical protein J7337_011195 [Fusarium musae]